MIAYLFCAMLQNDKVRRPITPKNFFTVLLRSSLNF
jgi:hypothetical protein